MSSKLSLYADDDETTVITTMVDVEVGVASDVTVGAHVLLDAVSSASVDVVAAATERWTENRIEAGVTAAGQVVELDLSLAFVHSGENDWTSDSVQVTAGKELAQKNTLVQMGYAYTQNQVGRAYDPVFERDLDAHTFELGGTQLLDPRTLLGLTYTYQRSDGYQASPYRFVTTEAGMSFPELHPERRSRHGITLRALRAIGDTMGLDTTYRLYTDGWGVTSHTVGAALAVELGDATDAHLYGRAYYQSAAEFFEESYASPMVYMSADRELGSFWDVGGGLKLARSIGPATLDAKVSGIYYRFLDFARLEGRVAIVTTGGVAWQW